VTTIYIDWITNAVGLRDVNSEIFAEPSLLVDAGFVNIVSQYVPWYTVGNSDPNLEELTVKNWMTGIDATRPMLTASLGISDSEFDDVTERAKKEVQDPSKLYKLRNTLYSHYGQKPAVQR